MTDKQNTIKNTIPLPALIIILGFGSLIALNLSYIYSDIFSLQSSEGALYFSGTRTFFFLGMTFAYLLLANSKKFLAIFKNNNFAFKILCLVISLILPVFRIIDTVSLITIPLPLCFFAWIIFGFVNGLMYCCWVEFMGKYDDETIHRIALASMFVASLFFVVTISMESMSALITSLLLTFCSVLFLMPPIMNNSTTTGEKNQTKRTASSTNTTKVSQKDNPVSRFKSLGSVILVFDGALIAFIGFLCLTAVQSGYLVPICLPLAIMSSILIYMIVRRVDILLLSPQAMQFVFFPIVCTGLLLLFINDSTIHTFTTIILFAFVFIFDFCNLMVLCLAEKRKEVPISRFFSAGRVYICIGHSIGWLICAVVPFSTDSSFICSIAGIFIVLFSFFVSIYALLPRNRNNFSHKALQLEPEGTPDEEKTIGRFKKRCNEVADSFKLTSRESEILTFLAKGRNARYIAEELVVTERTVKTHIYHVYQKMGIHTQQELIDIVDDKPKDN